MEQHRNDSAAPGCLNYYPIYVALVVLNMSLLEDRFDKTTVAGLWVNYQTINWVS